MMPRQRKVFVGSVGVKIKVAVGVSLEGVSSMELVVEKPDGSTAVNWTAYRIGANEDGLLGYNTVSGDLNVPGIYRLHSKLVFTSGNTFYGERTYFTVETPGEG